jgi:phosphoglycolate phosphatase
VDRKITYEELAPQMGLEENIFLNAVMPHISEKKRSVEYNRKVVPLIYSSIFEEGGKLYDGVKVGLEKLSIHYELFIVSNCPAKGIDYFMKYAEISDIITDSMAYGQNLKTKSENIRLLMERHDLVNPVYVGDTDSDRFQCQKAGLPFIFVDYGFGQVSQYRMKFSDFFSLVEWFCWS